MAASGATRLGGGGDVRVAGKLRVECKFTEKSSYSLKYSELRKIRKQAFKSLEAPVFQFAFRHPSGRLRSYAVIPWLDKDAPNIWPAISASITLTEDQLEKALMAGPIQLTYVHTTSDPLLFRTFEIMRWHDYIEIMTLKSKD